MAGTKEVVSGIRCRNGKLQSAGSLGSLNFDVALVKKEVKSYQAGTLSKLVTENQDFFEGVETKLDGALLLSTSQMNWREVGSALLREEDRSAGLAKTLLESMRVANRTEFDRFAKSISSNFASDFEIVWIREGSTRESHKDLLAQMENLLKSQK